MGDLAKKYNLKSPAVKRLMREAAELSEPTDQYFAQPLEDNLFEWHFTVRGPPDTEFEDGRYHGRITMPPEYPMKPPSIILLTPNGRFEIGKKICLSMSAHHPETWQPSWSIRTVLLALIGFMPTPGGGAIGALDHTPEERKTLARRSKDWNCESCGSNNNTCLLERDLSKEKQESEETKELAAQINFKGESKEKEESNQTQPPTNAQLQQQMYGNFAQYYGMQNYPMQFPSIPNQMFPHQQQQQQEQPMSPTQSNLTTDSPSNTNTTTSTTENIVSFTNENDTTLRQRVREVTNEMDNNSSSQHVTSSTNETNQAIRTTPRPTSRVEHVTLVLTWIVAACLVILVLRRLAMEGNSLGN